MTSGPGCFAFLWAVACVLFVIVCLFALPRDVIGRLCSLIVAIPRHLLYFYIAIGKKRVHILFLHGFACCVNIMAAFNSSGAKFQTTFAVCLLHYIKLSFGKTFICKVERLNVNQRRSR